MQITDVIIIGGGLAGIQAAIDLVDRGFSVKLIEKSKSLGGRAGSHLHQRDGDVDVGQHVYIGGFHRYIHLLQQLGTAHLAPLEPKLNLLLIDGGEDLEAEIKPVIAQLEAAPLPYPLSMVGAIMRYRHMSLSERLSTLGLMRVAKSDWENNQDQLEHISFSTWLENAGVSENSMHVLWEPLTVATLNSKPDEVSAYAGVIVIVKALLGGRDAAKIGIPRVPLSRLFSNVSERIAPLGQVHLGQSAGELIIDNIDNSRQSGEMVSTLQVKGVVLQDGQALRSKYVVVAVAHPELPRLFPRRLARQLPFLEQINQIGSNPIINVHLTYDRPVTDRIMLGFVRSPLQWLFNVTALHGSGDRRQEDNHLGYEYRVSTSAPGKMMGMKSDDLIALMDSELRRLMPSVRNAVLLKGNVRKMRHATFSSPPGGTKNRPSNDTQVKNLFLAGDYTNTGWPSTMEGAVLSGAKCAKLIAEADAAEDQPNHR